VKWRFFRHLLGYTRDDRAEKVYRWHIRERSGARLDLGIQTDKWKRDLDDYVLAASDLAASMKVFGFLPDGAIPVDADGELLGGAHRVACAIAVGMPHVTVTKIPRKVWAPPWHREWFVEHGMAQDDLRRLDDDWELMRW
jgi:hypothetical protein